MVRIAENKLIIEFSTPNPQEPLALLADLQKGMIDLISVIPYGNHDTPNEHLDFGMYIITILMREMTITAEQASCLSKNLNKQQILEINKWGK